MIARAIEAGVAFGWVTADEAYGQVGRLRSWLEDLRVAHVLAVPKSQMVISMGLTQERAHRLVSQLSDVSWMRLSCGDGAHGPRIYDWAAVDIRAWREPGVGHWLLARRSTADPSDIAYYICYGPADTPLTELVRVAGSRWAIEECFQATKNEAGLDHYQVRGYRAWYRHITLSMAAAVFLTITRNTQKRGSQPETHTPEPQRDTPSHRPHRLASSPYQHTHSRLVGLPANQPNARPHQPLQTKDHITTCRCSTRAVRGTGRSGGARR